MAVQQLLPLNQAESDQADVAQLTVPGALLLHLGPGACVFTFIVLVTPSLISRGLPAQLGFLAGIALVGIPLELGRMLYLGKKRNSVVSLRGVVRYTQQMPLWQYLVLFVPFVIYGLGLQVVYSPVATTLSTKVFGRMPAYLLPQSPSSALGPLTAVTLVTALLTLALDGIINPVIEELYFRGYLLPRLSGWGWLAPVISALLFALQHFWQPYNILLIFLLVLPKVLIVRWKRNVRFSILCHCFANTLGAILTLIALLSR